MIGWASAEKTGAAVGFLSNDAAVRRDGSRSFWIGRAKHGNNRQAYRSRDVHRTGIVADKEMALRKERR